MYWYRYGHFLYFILNCIKIANSKCEIWNLYNYMIFICSILCSKYDVVSKKTLALHYVSSFVLTLAQVQNCGLCYYVQINIYVYNWTHFVFKVILCMIFPICTLTQPHSKRGYFKFYLCSIGHWDFHNFVIRVQYGQLCLCQMSFVYIIIANKYYTYITLLIWNLVLFCVL